jgi:hypothetical protein
LRLLTTPVTIILVCVAAAGTPWAFSGFQADTSSSQTFTLSVALRGSGRGSITSVPAGITCGSTCTGDFATGTEVSLSATADSGASFTEWGGNCSGSAGCILTMVASQTVTATFSAVYTDPVLDSGIVVKAAHFQELRAAVDALRAQNFGLAAFAFTDPVLGAGTTIRATHIAELRTALNEAFAAAGRTAPTYTDPSISTGVTIKAAHISELRAAASSVVTQTSPRSSYDYKRTAPWVVTGGVNSTGYADFNGDGLTDYVRAFISGNTNTVPIKMFLQNSQSEYVEDASLLPNPVPGTVHPRKIVVGDFNGDGVPDFLVADHGYDQPPFPGAVPLLMLSGAGKFATRSLSGVPTGFQHSATAADLRHQGMLDIFVSDSTNGAFLLVNDGNGNFTVSRATLPTSPAIGAGYYTSELIDLDGDGHVDLLVGGHEQDGAITRIFWGDSSGSFTNARRTDVPADETYRIVLDFVAADTDGDGHKELILNRTKSDPFYQGYYFQIVTVSNRQLTDVSTRITPNKATWEGSTAQWIDWIQVGDVNSSGGSDLRAMDKARNIRFTNDGQGHFTRAP